MFHRLFPRTRKALLAAATLLALATAACGGDDKGGTTGPSTPPPPSGPAMLKINNQTTDQIAEVRIRLCTLTGDFGPNLISNPINGGTSRTMEVPAGCYDVGVWSTPEVGQDAYKSDVVFIAGVTKTLNLPYWP